MGNYFIHNGQWYSADELYHHGVKGMKWGVRRSKAQLARARGKTDSEKEQLSDDEVNTRINKLLEDASAKCRNIREARDKIIASKYSKQKKTIRIIGTGQERERGLEIIPGRTRQTC